MGARSEIESWIRDIGRRIGQDFSLDATGRCAFNFGPDLIGVIAVQDGSDSVLFYVSVARVPDGDPMPFYEMVLEQNLHGKGTDGATLGLDPFNGDIVLSQRWPWGMVRPDDFATLLGNFIGTAIRVHEFLSGNSTPQIHSAVSSSDELLGNLTWRV